MWKDVMALMQDLDGAERDLQEHQYELDEATRLEHDRMRQELVDAETELIRYQDELDRDAEQSMIRKEEELTRKLEELLDAEVELMRCQEELEKDADVTHRLQQLHDAQVTREAHPHVIYIIPVRHRIVHRLYKIPYPYLINYLYAELVKVHN